IGLAENMLVTSLTTFGSRQTGRWMGEEAPKRTAAAGYITETTHPIDWVPYHQMDGNKSYGASFHTDNRIRYM
ncbi:hypothetical protein J6590_104341, partial [Homalodisca vitripennis]